MKKPGAEKHRASEYLERNTGFEPATFALATRQPAIHDSPLPPTNQQDPMIFLGSSEGSVENGSTNVHADSRPSCAQHVPRFRRCLRDEVLNVRQVAALLGCSTAHVYDLCAQGRLPCVRDVQNRLAFSCRDLGKTLGITKPRVT